MSDHPAGPAGTAPVRYVTIRIPDGHCECQPTYEGIVLCQWCSGVLDAVGQGETLQPHHSWFRSLTPNGQVWSEGRDPAEVAEPHPELIPLTYQRLDTYEFTDDDWKPWHPGTGDPS